MNGLGPHCSPCCVTGIPLLPTVVQDLQQAVSRLEARLSALEKSSPAHRATAPQTQVSVPDPGMPHPMWAAHTAGRGLPTTVCSWGRAVWASVSFSPWQHVSPMRQVEPPTKRAATAAEDDEGDDIDLFGSDEEEDKEAARLREERLRQYAERKAKKPALVAKSSILLDVKPVSGSPLTLSCFAIVMGWELS